jgi:hypothetical protein
MREFPLQWQPESSAYPVLRNLWMVSLGYLRPSAVALSVLTSVRILNSGFWSLNSDLSGPGRICVYLRCPQWPLSDSASVVCIPDVRILSGQSA